MAVPEGFTEVRRRELEDGRVLVACKDDRQGIHIEIPAGPFSRRDAGRIAECVVLALDYLPSMNSTEEQARRRAE